MPNTYLTSTGERLTERQIRTRYTHEKKGWLMKYVCECCESRQVGDPDHTISQSDCKNRLGKTELIWNEQNVSWSCRTCHQEWESYRDGKFSYHKNAYDRMVFTALHDREGFMKRWFCITNPELKKELQPYFDHFELHKNVF